MRAFLTIYREMRLIADEERSRPRVACPNDGTPLRLGPRNTLFCPMGDYRTMANSMEGEQG